MSPWTSRWSWFRCAQVVCQQPANRVIRIVKRHRQRVVENGNGFIKRDPMFSQTPLRLIWIPFELHEAILGKVAAHLTV